MELEQGVQDVLSSMDNADSSTAPETQDVNTGDSSTLEPDVNKADSSTANEEEKPLEDGQDVEDEDKNLPFGKHPRFQKMLNDNKDLKTKLEQYESGIKDVEGMKALNEWIKQDPKGVAKFLLSQAGEEETTKNVEQETPIYDTMRTKLEEFEPEVAEIFKFMIDRAEKYDKVIEEYEKNKAEAVKTRESVLVQREETNKEELDTEFDSMLISSGYMDKEGKGDEKMLTVIAMATKQKLDMIARSSKFPTKAELKSAFNSVVEGLGAIEKKGLLKNVKPMPPASGSNRGAIPIGKKLTTDQDIINDIVSQI